MTAHLQAMGTAWSAAAAVLGFWLTAWLIGGLPGGGTPAEETADEPGAPSSNSRPACGNAFLRLLLGANLLSLATLLIGLAGLIDTAMARGMLLAGGLGGLAMLTRHLTAARLRMAISWPWIWTLPVALLLLGPALCLPIGWDEQVYQIAVPWRWLRDGFPACHSDLPYAAFPGAGTMPVWLTLAAGGIVAPRLLIWTQWGLLCLGLGRLLRQDADASPSPWRASLLTAVFVLSPTVLMVASEAYMELFILLNGVGFLLASRNAARHSAWAPGICAGAILATKLTGALLLPALALALWRCRRPDPGTAASLACLTPQDCRASHADTPFRAVLIGLLTTLAFALPFYLRPWLLTGNPCHPFFAGWFGADPGELASSAYHHAVGGVKFGVEGVAGLPWNPVLIAWSGRVFDGHFGLAYLGILVLAAFAAWRIPRARTFLAMAGIAYLGWCLSARQARFLLPAFLFLLPAAALGLAALSRKGQGAAMAILAVLTLLGVPRPWRNHCRISWRAACGRIPQVDLLYTATGPGYLPILETIRQRTPPDATVMLLFEHRTLYVPRRTVIATPFFQGRLLTPPETVATPAELLAAIHASGATHVLLGLANQDPDRLPEYLDRCLPLATGIARLADDNVLLPIGQSDGFILYAVAAGARSRR